MNFDHTRHVLSEGVNAAIVKCRRHASVVWDANGHIRHMLDITIEEVPFPLKARLQTNNRVRRRVSTAMATYERDPLEASLLS